MLFRSAGTSDGGESASKEEDIETFFKPYPGGIPVDKFVHVTKRLCGLPSFFNLPLCRRIQTYFGDQDQSVRMQQRGGRAGEDIIIKLKTFMR